MGILASHAQCYMPLMETPFLIEGTKSMLVIWVVAIIAAALAALAIGALSLRTIGRLFHHDHARLRADALLLRDLAGPPMGARMGCRSISATTFRG